MKLCILLLWSSLAWADGVTHHISPDYEVQDGLGVVYVRVGTQRVARLVSTELAARMYPDAVPDGKITAGDAWAAGPAAPVGRMLLSSARRALYEYVPESSWLGHDQLGSVTVETGETGEVIGRRGYGPFGATRASSGDADRYGFTGQESDGTGLVHFQFRQLDPLLGRWASTDPLFATASAAGIAALGEATTAYAYVANNPSNGVDPTGLVEVKTIVGAVVLTGAVISSAVAIHQVGKLREEVKELKQQQHEQHQQSMQQSREQHQELMHRQQENAEQVKNRIVFGVQRLEHKISETALQTSEQLHGYADSRE